MDIVMGGMLLCGAAIVVVCGFINLPEVLRSTGKFVVVFLYAAADVLEAIKPVTAWAWRKNSAAFDGRTGEVAQ